MSIVIRRSLHFASSPERTFAVITAVENMTSFVGYGLIPGIADVELDGEVGPGGVLRVRNTDGSTHRERIEAYEPGRCYQLRIEGFDSALRWLASHAIERFEFHAEGDGCRVEREFRFTLTGPFSYPLALPILRIFFSRALDRNHERLRALVEADAGASASA